MFHLKRYTTVVGAPLIVVFSDEVMAFNNTLFLDLKKIIHVYMSNDKTKTTKMSLRKAKIQISFDIRPV